MLIPHLHTSRKRIDGYFYIYLFNVETIQKQGTRELIRFAMNGMLLGSPGFKIVAELHNCKPEIHSLAPRFQKVS